MSKSSIDCKIGVPAAGAFNNHTISYLKKSKGINLVKLKNQYISRHKVEGSAENNTISIF